MSSAFRVNVEFNYYSDMLREADDHDVMPNNATHDMDRSFISLCK